MTKKLIAGAAGLLAIAMLWLWWAGPATPIGPVDLAPGTAEALRVATAHQLDVGNAPDTDVVRRRLKPRTITDHWRLDTGTLRLRVVDEDGQPVSQVGLHVTPHDGRDPVVHGRRQVTDEQGQALIEDLAAGDVKVALDRQQTHVVAVRPGAVTEHEFVLPRGVTVDGLVVGADDAPIALADIWVRLQTAGYRSMKVAKTDAFGRFRLRCLVPRLTFIGAGAPGLAPSDMQPVAAPGSGPQAMRIVLRHPAASVRGLVVDSRDRPVAGAVIRAGGRFGGGSKRVSATVTHLGWAPVSIRSGADGSFSIRGLPPGEVEFLVHAGGYAPYTRHFDLRSATTNDVTITMVSGAALRGIVRDVDGAAIPGAHITVGSFGYVLEVSTTSSASGRFDLRGLDPRHIKLSVAAKGFARFVGSYAATPGARLEVEVPLVRERTIRGKLIGPDSVPLAGWLVLLRGRTGGPLTTDRHGRFRGSVGALRQTELWISPRQPRNFVACQWLGEVSITDDELEVLVPAELMPAARISGRLLANDGRAPRKATVSLLRDDARVQRLHPEPSDGSFRLGPVAPGSYRLTWNAEGPWGMTYGQRRLHVASTDLELGTLRTDAPEVTRAGWLIVQLGHRDGAPIESPSVHLFDQRGRELGIGVFLDAKGRGRQGLQPGSYALSVIANNAQWMRETFTIQPDQDSVVKLTLAPATRRYILFPWPVPSGWDAVDRVRYTLEDGRGTLLSADDLTPDDIPFMYMPGLQVGRHRLQLTTDDGRRYVGSFEVDGLGKSFRPIPIAVERAR